MSSTRPQVIFLLADYGHNPTETTVPYTKFKEAGYEITIATQHSSVPECDARMLTGWTQTLLGADKHTISLYKTMSANPEWKQPRAWTDPDFKLEDFDLVYLPGGHDKGIRQLLDCPRAQSLLASYFPHTRRSPVEGTASKPRSKFCAPICHGVQMLAHSKSAEGVSVLRDIETMTLPGFFEASVDVVTRMFLGDYYKTYGAGTDSVEATVERAIGHEKQFKVSLNTVSPFVVEDKTHWYFNGRWLEDASSLAEKVICAMGMSD